MNCTCSVSTYALLVFNALWMFHVITRSVLGAAGTGGGGGGGGGALGANRIHPKLPTAWTPFASSTTLIFCRPALSVTNRDTVAQFCHPPVLGMVNGPETSLPPTSTWNVPPCPYAATRVSRRYEPAVLTFTLY